MSIEVDEQTLQLRFLQALDYYTRKGTINTFARNCVKQLPGCDIEDIEQEVRICLWRCVQRYDPNRGAGFNTLFQGTARNHIISMVRTSDTKGRGKGLLVTLDEEAFAVAAERSRTEGSAEDWYLALEEFGDAFVEELELSVA